MSRLVIAAIVATCSAPAPKPVPPGGPATPAATAMATADMRAPAELSVEDAAVQLARAAIAGDTAGARALTMTHEQFVALSHNAPDKAELDEEVDDFLSGMAREFREAKASVVGAKVANTRTLDPATDSKVKYKVDVALVQLVIEQDGQSAPRGVPLLFIKTDAGWRFSPKR